MSLWGIAAATPSAGRGTVLRDRVLVVAASLAAVGAVAADLALGPTPTAGSAALPRLLAAFYCALAAAVLALSMADRARRDPARRLPVLGLALAFVLLMVGQSVGYALSATSGGDVDPWIEALPLLLAMPLAVASMVSLVWPRELSRSDLRTLVLDALVSVLGLAVLWWQVVVPRWTRPPGEGLLLPTVEQVATFGSLALVCLALVASRSTGWLPLPQVGLLVGGAAVYSLSDTAAALVAPVDGSPAVSPALVGYAVSLALTVAFAHRAAVEVESARQRYTRELVALATPLVVAVPAGIVVIALAADSAASDIPLLVATVAWILLLLAVVVGRVSTSLELGRVRRDTAAVVLAERTREGWFRALVGDSREIVLVVDVAGRVIYRSPRASSDLVAASSAPEPNLADVVVGASRADVRLLLAQAAVDPARRGPYDLEMHGSDGGVVEVEAVVRPVRDIEFEGYVVTARDVTDTRRLARQLATSRRRDDLTGLHSREAFLADLAVLLGSDDGPDDGRVAVVVIDLERFAFLNDGLGHETGDQILVAVARAFDRLPEDVRDVARLGSDSFAWCVVSTTPDAAVAEAVEQCRQELYGLLLPDGRELEISFRAGYVVAARDGARAPEWYVEAADLALGRARVSRHATLVAYDPQMRRDTSDRIAAEHRLRRALVDGRVEVRYQPIVRLADGLVLGAEALARIRDLDGQVLEPAAFIPLAEELGVIEQLGESVLRTACRDTVRVSQDIGRRLAVSVNVSAEQLRPKLVESVQSALADSGLDPSLLTLELTESALANRPETAELLRRLRAVGVTISLDDFGTGYSSMSYLATLPVSGLKIDRSFVSTMGTRPEGLTLARLVVQLSDALGLAVVAEGIETVEQSDLLRGMGCEYGQGFVFARPLDLAAYVDYLGGRVVRITDDVVAPRPRTR